MLRTADSLPSYFPELARWRAHLAVATVETEDDPRKVALDTATEVRREGNDIIVHISVAHALESVAAGALRANPDESSDDRMNSGSPSLVDETIPATSEERAATGGLVGKLHWLLGRAKDGSDGIQRAAKAVKAAKDLYAAVAPHAEKALKFFPD